MQWRETSCPRLGSTFLTAREPFLQRPGLTFLPQGEPGSWKQAPNPNMFFFSQTCDPEIKISIPSYVLK